MTTHRSINTPTHKQVCGTSPSAFAKQEPLSTEIVKISELSPRAQNILYLLCGTSNLDISSIHLFISKTPDWLKVLLRTKNCGWTTALEIRGFVEKMQKKHTKPLNEWCNEFVARIVELRDNTIDTWEGIGNKLQMPAYATSKLYASSKLKKPKYDLKEVHRSALMGLLNASMPVLPPTIESLGAYIGANPNWRESLKMNFYGPRVITHIEKFLRSQNF